MPQSRVRQLIGLLLGMAGLLVPADAATRPPESSPVRVKLRADWTIPNASAWDGIIRVGQGRIESVRPHELRSRQVRITSGNSDKEVRFRTDGPTSWCGLELVVDAPPCSSVELVLDGHRLETPLAELLSGSGARMTWEGSVRLRRDPADIVQVSLNRPHLVFAPGEPADLDLDFNLLTTEPRTVTTHLQVALRSARDGGWLYSKKDKLQSVTNSGDRPRRTVTIRAPVTEGAFDLVVRAEPDGMPPIERVVQLVVVSPMSQPATSSTELVTRLVEEIDPSQPTGAGPWYSSRRLMARTTRLGQFLWSSVRHPFSPAERTKESPVLQCQLNVQNPGRPHLLSIDYEDGRDVLFAASVTEQDPLHRWWQLPIASGVRSYDRSPTSGIQAHQLIIWPQTKAPLLTLYLPGPAGSGSVKRIRVQELPQGLPPLDVSEAEAPRRLFGMSLDNPDVWASWGSARPIDPTNGLAVDDWQTYLESMEHLAEYARFAGYNCIQPTVIGHGGALYPSSLLDPNLRLDSGSIADVAPDPIRKDVVELMLRVCLRNQLTLVPCLRLDGAIAELDRKASDSGTLVDGLLLVSREGKVWDSAIGRGILPVRRYNPLNGDVQAALLEVVREFVRRYASHPAFEAMSLDLAASSHMVLPGLDWGYDDATVAEFVRDTGVGLPTVPQDDPSRFAERHQYLCTTAREQWIAWRCKKLTELYQAMLAELQRGKPGARLVVSLTTVAGALGEELRDGSRSARTTEETLRCRGIDLRSWAALRDLVVLRPFIATASSLEGLQLNASRELDDLMACLPSRGSLCVHEPEVLHLAPPQGAADKGSEHLTETIALPVSAVGRLNLRSLAQSLASGDSQAIFEGGPALPIGHEQVQREFARVFRCLPSSEFQSIETLQPVVVRSRRTPRDTLIYMVNDASYPVETNVSFSCSPQTVLNNGATGDRLSANATEQGLGTKLTLEPFQTVYLKLTDAAASVVQCHVIVPQAAERGLKGRVDRLTQAMAILGRDATRTLDGLPANGDFETVADSNTPQHWIAEGDRGQCVADDEVTHGGNFALRLEGQAGSVVAGDAFKPPDGRALAMNVWLRAGRPGQRVRWFLLGKHLDETIYRCYADVPLGMNWEQKQFRARDLPDGQLTEVQIKFQLLDDGVVWVDDARVCALPISPDEKLAISKSVSAIVKAWKERRLSDFERLSNGYWATYLLESVEASQEREGIFDF